MLSAAGKAMLRLIAQGESDERIRQKLNIDDEGFHNCIDELYRELGVQERLELILFVYSTEGKLLLEAREAA